jgi:hypothetical protein
MSLFVTEHTQEKKFGDKKGTKSVPFSFRSREMGWTNQIAGFNVRVLGMNEKLSFRHRF